MIKPDDSSLTAEQYNQVRTEAQNVLLRSGAIGRFPTPIGDIMAAAEVEEVPEDVLSESFLIEKRRAAGSALKRALGKVVGLFDARARLIFIDHGLHSAKKVFVRLHETGHGFLKWQRDLYALIEECEQSLNQETADLFDREANVFASEVLFQLDAFTNEADEAEFGILTPVRLSRKYGASIYASVRRYVSKNNRACAVLVLNPPKYVDGSGFRCKLRRVVVSSRFREIFGDVDWAPEFTPGDAIGKMVPIGRRKMSGPRHLMLLDLNRQRRECIAEAFTQTHQTFVLLHASGHLIPPAVITSSAHTN